jgi:hypothetical protein
MACIRAHRIVCWVARRMANRRSSGAEQTLSERNVTPYPDTTNARALRVEQNVGGRGLINGEEKSKGGQSKNYLGGPFGPPIQQRPQPLGYFRCYFVTLYLFPSWLNRLEAHSHALAVTQSRSLPLDSGLSSRV